ncbi:hypothetical protein [Clostridium rectalis]|uniref:hypothetical protein n=1 Tax=Clostridium rectalis TaxID=2040295 RepID=UPI000F637363|nr:hypothetical protein [Clostridium rectalis]
MVNANFKLKLIKDGKEKYIDVILQEVSPFVAGDIFSSAIDIKTGNYKMGTVAERGIEELVVSPKNLKEQILEAENPFEIIAKLFSEFQKFCQKPKQYALLQTESQTKHKNLEHSDS